MDWSKELLLIDKHLHDTSFDVIRQLRRMYKETHDGERAPKMGHAGTLDPLATGLMLIGLRKGTKMLAELTKLDKEYIAHIRLGESRTTGDLAGEIVERAAVQESAAVLQEKALATLPAMLGDIELPVSAYSAIKVDGVPMYKRAYKAAKKGEVVADVPFRMMKVLEANLLEVSQAEGRVVIKVRFVVGSGTYVRSLAEELGRRLGYPACLEALRRTQVGNFKIEDALVLPPYEKKNR